MSSSTADDTKAAAASSIFRRDVLAGLGATPRAISPKYFYDQRGSELFDQITELEAYYPTRTERSILETNAADMATALGPDVMLIEPGAGASIKVRVLLEAMENVAAFVPVEISGDHLHEMLESMHQEFPDLAVHPVVADFTAEFTLPTVDARRRVVFFPGSTIGNLDSSVAQEWLARMARLVGEDGGLLIGIDLPKDVDVLETAYDDPSGVTAAFNLNLLHRMRDELGATLDIDGFAHRAKFNPGTSRVEIHLVAKGPQEITLDGQTFAFEDGDSIHTENSHKYSIERFTRIAEASGWTLQKRWTDERQWFAELYFTVAPSAPDA